MLILSRDFWKQVLHRRNIFPTIGTDGGKIQLSLLQSSSFPWSYPNGVESYQSSTMPCRCRGQSSASAHDLASAPGIDYYGRREAEGWGAAAALASRVSLARI